MDSSLTDMPVLVNRPPLDPVFLPREELRALTPSDLTRRVTALAPRIAELAGDAERLRRPSDEAWNALRRSGYFYQFTPKAFGGMATDLESFMDATLPVAEACPSTAWVAAFCAVHNRDLANFPESVQQDLWGNDRGYVIAPRLSPSTPPAMAKPADGGVRLSGRWTWATGIVHADWIFAVALVPCEGPPQMVLALFPADEARVMDTWHVDGMAGTGSHDVEVEDLFVPEERVLRDLSIIAGAGPASRRYPEPIYRAPMATLSGLAAAIPVLGAARRAVTLFRDVAMERTIKGGQERQADMAAAQIRLSRADMMVKSAEMTLRDIARSMGCLGSLPPAENVAGRIAARARMTLATDLCRQATRILADGAGSTAHRLDQPFQRLVRDVALACTHVFFEVDGSHELHGRNLLGREPNSFVF